jgi:hypothetical protein
MTGSPNPASDGLNAPVSPTSISDSLSSRTEVPSEPSPVTIGFESSITRTDYDDDEDPREDLENPQPGWPKLAKLIADNPDFEAFPAFTDLNIKSLLYYQAELSMLRRELHATEYDDAHSLDDEVNKVRPSRYAKTLDYLFISRDKNDPELHKQWTLIKDIRKVLKEYSTLRALLDQGYC